MFLCPLVGKLGNKSSFILFAVGHVYLSWKYISVVWKIELIFCRINFVIIENIDNCCSFTNFHLLLHSIDIKEPTSVRIIRKNSHNGDIEIAFRQHLVFNWNPNLVPGCYGIRTRLRCTEKIKCKPKRYGMYMQNLQ